MIVLLVLCIVLVARPGRCADDDEEAVRGIIAEIIAADNRGDLETVMSLYAVDALLLPPGEEPVRGYKAIEARYRDIFSQSALALTSRVDDVRLADGWALARGAITGSATETTSGTVHRIDDKFVMILERTPAGRWVISELMWSSNRR